MTEVTTTATPVEEPTLEQMQQQKGLYELAVQHLQTSQLTGKDAVGLVQCQQFFMSMAQALATGIAKRQGNG